MKLTHVQWLTKIASDIADCKHESKLKDRMKDCIEMYLSEKERYHLTQEEIEILKQELLNYLYIKI